MTCSPKNLVFSANIRSASSQLLSGGGVATSSVAAEEDGDPHASVTERAAAVMHTGRITLDAKLGVFTVMGTVEPRVVQLHPHNDMFLPGRWWLLPRAGSEDVGGDSRHKRTQARDQPHTAASQQAKASRQDVWA